MRVAQILLGKKRKRQSRDCFSSTEIQSKKTNLFFPFWFFSCTSPASSAHIGRCSSCRGSGSSSNLQQKRRQHSIFVFPPLRPRRQFFIVYHISEGFAPLRPSIREILEFVALPLHGSSSLLLLLLWLSLFFSLVAVVVVVVVVNASLMLLLSKRPDDMLRHARENKERARKRLAFARMKDHLCTF